MAIVAFRSFNYTENPASRNLPIEVHNDGHSFMLTPAETASRFLTDDDIELFSGFKKKNFLAPPWKGLVISAATNNFPLATKPSMIGVFTLNYNNFTRSSCDEKKETSIIYNIDYVYSDAFACPGFTQMGESSEGLVLYKFDNKK